MALTASSSSRRPAVASGASAPSTATSGDQPQEASGLDIRPHECRHSYVTHVRAAGVNDANLAEIAVGWRRCWRGIPTHWGQVSGSEIIDRESEDSETQALIKVGRKEGFPPAEIDQLPGCSTDFSGFADPPRAELVATRPP